MKILLLSLLSYALRIVNIGIWAYVILSWFANANDTVYKIYSFLATIIEPVLAPIRKLLMPITYKIGLDFSPYVLALAASAVYRIVAGIIILL